MENIVKHKKSFLSSRRITAKMDSCLRRNDNMPQLFYFKLIYYCLNKTKSRVDSCLRRNDSVKMIGWFIAVLLSFEKK